METSVHPETPPYNTLRLITRYSEHGKTIEEMNPLGMPDFAEYAICNDNDGSISFPDTGIHAHTDIGRNPRRTNNQDGIYANPNCRAIAGADGCGGHSLGETAAALILAGFHSGIVNGCELNELPAYARRHITNRIERFLPPDVSPTHPAATAGFARENIDNGKVFIEGFTAGDYKAVIIDLNTALIEYVSRDQNDATTMVEDGVLTPAEAMTSGYANIIEHSFRAYDARERIHGEIPYSGYDTKRYDTERKDQFFRKQVARGHRTATLLYSDGISHFLTPEDIRAITLKTSGSEPEAVIRAILEELDLREKLSVTPGERRFSFLMEGRIVKSERIRDDIRDNRSIAVMITEA